MSIEITGNMIVALVVAGIVLYVIISMLRKQMRKSATHQDTIVKPDRSIVTHETKDAIPKLPKNETLYQILTNNQLTANDAAFDFRYMLEEIVLRIQQDVRSNKVELLFDIAEDIPPKLLGSPKRLSRVLINLIENGVKYSEEGVVELQISLKSKTENSAVLSFVVKDHGKGMDDTEVQALFSDPQTREKDGHLPLGFYVANQLIVSEKGEVTVLSRPEEGTRVLFDLKFALPKGEAALHGRCRQMRAIHFVLQ